MRGKLRPNGLEVGCPAEAGTPSLLYGTPAGEARWAESAARRVSSSELLGHLPFLWLENQ
jgi:hypothetical protein